ncbi:MAG: DUF6503 family protein [Bacteroidota bacterium]
MRIFILIICLVVGTMDICAQSPRGIGCHDNPLTSKLDFWIGEWVVYTHDTLAAYSSIIKSVDGCSLNENYRTVGGYTGQSLNYYDPADSTYKQVWVDRDNWVAHFHELDSRQGYIQFKAIGQPLRMDYRLDPATGYVLQRLEQTTDGGESWMVVFSGEYRPRYAISAAELLEKSRGFYDPDDSWSTLRDTFKVIEPRLGNPERASTVMFNRSADYFRLERYYGPDLIVFEIEGESCSWAVNDRTEIPEEERQDRRLNCSRNRTYASFYSFFYGMPMEILSREYEVVSEPEFVVLEQNSLLKTRLRIPGAPFAELWDVYFDLNTSEIKACEYFPEDPEAHNNLIFFERTFQKSGMKFPQTRIWYEDDQYRGTDVGF